MMNTEQVKELCRISAYLGAAYPAGATEGENWGLWLVKVATLTRRLHKRYENVCNYAWASEPKYEKGTERLKQRLVRLMQAAGFTIVENWAFNAPCAMAANHFALQGDPRGATLKVYAYGQVFYF
jgi:hypothetical protein